MTTSVVKFDPNFTNVNVFLVIRMVAVLQRYDVTDAVHFHIDLVYVSTVEQCQL